MQNPRFILTASLAAFLSTFAAGSALAQTRTWDATAAGAGNLLWSTTTNWVGGNVPDSSGESATFGSATAPGSINLTQDLASVTLNGLNVNTGTSNASATLTISGNAITFTSATATAINRGSNFAGNVVINTDLVLNGNSAISAFSNMTINGNISGPGTLVAGRATNGTFNGVLTTAGLQIRGSTTSAGQTGVFRAGNVNVLGSLTGPITWAGGTNATTNQGGSLQLLWNSGEGTIASALDFGATESVSDMLAITQVRGGTVNFTTNSITNGAGDRALRLTSGTAGSGQGTIKFSGQGWTITRNVDIGGNNDSASSVAAVNNSANLNLEFANTSGTQTISGNIGNSTGSSGTTTITRSGIGGTTVLSGTNTLSAAVNVSGGTLLINGNSSGITGAVTVGANGILGGNGTIGGATTINGSLSAGSAALTAGTLTFSNGLDISGVVLGGLFFDLGTASDLVSVGGALALGTLDGSDFTWNVGTGFGPGDYTLFSANSISGTVDGSIFSVGGSDAFLSQVGNNIVLTVVPEPGTWAMVATGFLGLMIFVRRRRLSQG